ncbi:hypothetical protein EJV47_05285 [Hymenobacter gummosus]|uniref:VCBS repeat-containing protein n=1 Tax=Hymenobacter gummosus TaxID=1776032 RepID=A0A431U6X2_9BACT|nr:hypothetical protein [Hymenobacter gummosus]RTQ52428.1 hypothetical protein EJV47_05285 [Hymenobacter gummosus]
MKLLTPVWQLGAAALVLLGSCDSARSTTDTSSGTATVETTVTTPGDVAFSRDLSQGEYRFQIQSNTLDNGQQLTIKTRRGDALVTDPVRLNVKGNVTDAVMGDLNGNGNPELYVFTSGGTMGMGGVEAYEFVDKSFRPIQALPKLSNDLATGYKGEDKYEIRGNRLVRTYPVYTGTDASATATGQSQTVEYQLNAQGLLTPTQTTPVEAMPKINSTTTTTAPTTTPPKP